MTDKKVTETIEHFRRMGKMDDDLESAVKGGCAGDACEHSNHICPTHKKICMSDHDCKLDKCGNGGEEFYCKGDENTCGFEFKCTPGDEYHM